MEKEKFSVFDWKSGTWITGHKKTHERPFKRLVYKKHFWTTKRIGWTIAAVAWFCTGCIFWHQVFSYLGD